MSFNRFWIQTSEVQDLSLWIGPVWTGIFPSLTPITLPGWPNTGNISWQKTSLLHYTWVHACNSSQRKREIREPLTGLDSLYQQKAWTPYYSTVKHEDQTSVLVYSVDGGVNARTSCHEPWLSGSCDCGVIQMYSWALGQDCCIGLGPCNRTVANDISPPIGTVEDSWKITEFISSVLAVFFVYLWLCSSPSLSESSDSPLFCSDYLEISERIVTLHVFMHNLLSKEIGVVTAWGTCCFICLYHLHKDNQQRSCRWWVTVGILQQGPHHHPSCCPDDYRLSTSSDGWRSSSGASSEKSDSSGNQSGVAILYMIISLHHNAGEHTQKNKLVSDWVFLNTDKVIDRAHVYPWTVVLYI